MLCTTTAKYITLLEKVNMANARNNVNIACAYKCTEGYIMVHALLSATGQRTIGRSYERHLEVLVLKADWGTEQNKQTANLYLFFQKHSIMNRTE